MGETKITILCENSAGALFGLTGEHGFSALIEKDGEKILFDTGQGYTLKHNASILGVDFKEINKIVISHGHYDHTGGLIDALYPPRGVEVYLHPDCFGPKYARIPTPQGERHVFIGIRFKKEFLESSLMARFIYLKEFKEIAKGIYFSGEIPKQEKYAIKDKRLVVKTEDGSFVEDPFNDDISLLIETQKGPVVLLGCAHSGVVNILRYLSDKTGYKEFYAVIGGTHLGFFPPGESLNHILDELERFSVKLIAVSHCTGPVAAAHCYMRFKDRFEFANVGWSKVF
jgi:7,8-dihydropterin-6-yl-methyl-4-(beta-D-ribofuranosyl)aminobenzene 5'-phosphate synthase